MGFNPTEISEIYANVIKVNRKCTGDCNPESEHSTSMLSCSLHPCSPLYKHSTGSSPCEITGITWVTYTVERCQPLSHLLWLKPGRSFWVCYWDGPDALREAARHILFDPGFDLHGQPVQGHHLTSLSLPLLGLTCSLAQIWKPGCSAVLAVIGPTILPTRPTKNNTMQEPLIHISPVPITWVTVREMTIQPSEAGGSTPTFQHI